MVIRRLANKRLRKLSARSDTKPAGPSSRHKQSRSSYENRVVAYAGPFVPYTVGRTSSVAMKLDPKLPDLLRKAN